MDVKVDQLGDVYCPFPTLLTIPTVDRIRTVACGYGHTAAVSMDGRLFVWGSGNSGRLGLGTLPHDASILCARCGNADAHEHPPIQSRSR